MAGKLFSGLLKHKNFVLVTWGILPGVSNPQPVGRTWARMAVNSAHHKIINLLKIL